MFKYISGNIPHAKLLITHKSMTWIYISINIYTYELKVLNKKITLSYGFMVSLSCNT